MITNSKYPILVPLLSNGQQTRAREDPLDLRHRCTHHRCINWSSWNFRNGNYTASHKSVHKKKLTKYHNLCSMIILRFLGLQVWRPFPLYHLIRVELNPVLKENEVAALLLKRYREFMKRAFFDRIQTIASYEGNKIVKLCIGIRSTFTEMSWL